MWVAVCRGCDGVCPNTSRHLHWVQVFDMFTLGQHIRVGTDMFILHKLAVMCPSVLSTLVGE